MSKEELTSLFGAYLICGQYSPMLPLVESIVRAFRFDLRLTVQGPRSENYVAILDLLRSLGISFNELKYTAMPIGNPKHRLVEPSINDGMSLLVPDPSESSLDIGARVAYYIEKHLLDLRQKVAQFPEPQVDQTYLLLIQSLMRFRGVTDLSARILQDMLAVEESKILSLCYTSTPLKDAQFLYQLVKVTDKLTQLYVGFNSSVEYRQTGSKEFMIGCAFLDQINKAELARHNSYLSTVQPGTHSSKSLMPEIFPYYVRQFTFGLMDVELVGMNLNALKTVNSLCTEEVKEKVANCLRLRLKGISEADICQSLGFTELGMYEEWLKEHCISLKSMEIATPYQRHKLAKECVEQFAASLRSLSPNAETSRQPVDIHVPALEMAEQPKSQLVIFAPDFRSINITGKEHGATPKQAAVLLRLYDQLELGIPSIGINTVIEEVYSGSSSKNLRKLFANDTLYDRLIGEGSTRGTARLRDCFKYSVPLRKTSVDD